jgi:hypothetical protein
MPFDAMNRYSGNHKTWDHVGNVIPDIGVSDGQLPAFEFRPSPWLPVKFYDKKYEDWITVLPGKPVALDPDGCVMPVEYGLTGASVVYTTNDVVAGTIDVATGVAVTTAKTVVLANLSGSKDATWTNANAGTGSVTSGFMGRFGESFGDASKKYPIGVAPYPYIKAPGGDGFNPVDYYQHNYNRQHLVAVLCDYVIKLPLVPGQAASETVDKTLTAANLTIGTQAGHNRQYALSNTTGRYDPSTGEHPVLTTYPVVALALDNYPVAKNTTRTPIVLVSDNTADDVSDVLVTEVSSLSGITKQGDFWVDYDVGVIFIYSAAGIALPTSMSGASGSLTITYYYNATAPSVVSVFAQVLAGSIKAGDFLKAGTESNYTLASTEDFKDILGQVLGFIVHPRGGLDRVRTAWSPAISTDATGAMSDGTLSSLSANAGQLDQMPGSATGGYPDLIHYAGAADTLVVVNLVSR